MRSVVALGAVALVVAGVATALAPATAAPAATTAPAAAPAPPTDLPPAATAPPARGGTTAAFPPATTAAFPPATTAAFPPATTAAFPPATTAAFPPATTAAFPPATTAAFPPATAATLSATAATPSATTTASAPARDPERPTWTLDDGTRLRADSTDVEIAVRPDGTAVWTIHHRVQLDDAETEARFERVNRSIHADPLNYTGPFAERMAAAASLAADETGREMAVGNVSVRASEQPTREGVVTYRCVWTGFAATGDGRIEIGDALVGFDLSNDRTSLVVQWPAGYDVERVTPEPDRTGERAAVWHGPVEFAPAEPRVVVTGGSPLPVDPARAVVAAAAVAAAVVAGWGLRLGVRALPTGGAGGADAAEGDAAAAGADDAEVPEELLSDAERVLGLVEDNGGRMKQQDVVAALDWSETKTSQVVNDLEDEGNLEIYNIGRENVLSLPGEMDV